MLTATTLHGHQKIPIKNSCKQTSLPCIRQQLRKEVTATVNGRKTEIHDPTKLHIIQRNVTNGIEMYTTRTYPSLVILTLTRHCTDISELIMQELDI